LDDGTGDVLCAWLQEPDDASKPARPLLVLIHGLAGCEESSYMEVSARTFVERGYRVLRLNLRGAGPSRASCRLQYHAGRTADLRAALHALQRDHSELSRAGFLLTGFSLGGNMLLKFLAEYPDEFCIHKAVTVSAPLDLSATAQRILKPRNALYQRHLLSKMRKECFGKGAEISQLEKERVLAARSIYEYDEVFIAPRNGYRSAEHYYAENSAKSFLSEIRYPTLLIQSLDDPWIPEQAYREAASGSHEFVYPILARGGGHLGFHGKRSEVPWHNLCMKQFFEQDT
jgi:predicted alpha/beta-fold hydrolase